MKNRMNDPFAKLSSFVVFFVLAASQAEAHIKITPVGRMGTGDAFKFIQNNKANPTAVPDSPGPCQNFNTRMATPIQLTPKQQFTFQVQETINHPGRFYVQFSQAGDQNFWLPANQLALVQDPGNRLTTPVTFTVPDVNCNTCTFRVLQEMDDQPGEYYVHCVDVNIGTVASTPPPTTPGTGGREGANSVTKLAEKPSFGGCGMIQSNHRSGPGPGPSGGLIALLFGLPLVFTLFLRRRTQLAKAL